MYNRFDRIKITVDFNNTQYQSNLFNTERRNNNDRIISAILSTVGLRIKVNHLNNKIYIDFSAKILKEKYIEKINILNIMEIYKEITKYIDINLFQFLRAESNYCEIVNDIKIENIPDKINAMYDISKFQDKYKPSPKLHKTNGEPTSFWLKKNVISRESNEYVSIYNKYNELFCKKNENIYFLHSLAPKQVENIEQYFKNVLRFESKFSSKKRIKYRFEFQNNSTLYLMLKSEININEEIINDIYDKDLMKLNTHPNIIYKQLDKISTLELYNNDLEKIYQMYREMGSKVQKSKMLKPYKKLLFELEKKGENEKITQILKIKEKIKW